MKHYDKIKFMNTEQIKAEYLENLRELVSKRFRDLRDDTDIPKKSQKGKIINTESMRDLAKSFGTILGEYYDHTKISRLENNVRVPTLDDLFLYHTKYNVTYDYLLGITENKFDDTTCLYEKYGLSDKALDTLKNFQNNSEKDKINKAINTIFASDNAFDFLLSLYEYLFENFEDKVPDTYNVTNGELAEIEFKSKAGDIELGSYLTNVKNLRTMNLQIVMSKIEDIRMYVNGHRQKKIKKQATNSEFMESLMKNQQD